MRTEVSVNAADAEALELVDQWGSLAEAARQTGIKYRTLQGRYRRAKQLVDDTVRKPLPDSISPSTQRKVDYPDLPCDELPFDEWLDAKMKTFARKDARKKAEKWFRIKLSEDKPFAIVAFGDPHMDDDSCNWPQLKLDVDTVAGTPGMYGLNIGDVTNNWVGRLTKKYAAQDATIVQARRAAEAFFNDWGVHWLCHLVGNHDDWEHGAAILNLVKNRPEVPLLDWRAQFVLEFPKTGKRLLVDAAHDFKGKSQDNPLAGPAKAAIRQSPADLFLCGHQHHGSIMKMPIGGDGRVVGLGRASGYKAHDEYAWKNGFDDTDFCHAVVAVIDPNSDNMGRDLQLFDNVQLASEYLTFARSRP